MQVDEHNSDLQGHISVLEAAALSFGCIVGWGSFVMPGNAFLPAAGPAGTAIALVASAATMCIIALCYHYMMQKHPTTGGCFEFALQTFGRNHAFVCAWAVGLAYIALIPQNATALTLIARNLLGSVLETGPHYTVLGYETYLSELVMIGLVLALFALVMARSNKIGAALQTVMALCLFIGIAGLFASVFASPDVKLADTAPPFNPNANPAFGIASVFAIAPWAFLGFDTLSQSTGEFGFPVRKAGPIMVVTIVAGLFVYLANNLIAASVVPAGFASWPEYVGALDSFDGVQSLPTFNTLFQVLGDIGLRFGELCALCAILTGVFGFYRAASRLLFAMGREGALPRWFGYAHPRYGTPTHAIVFLLVASAISSIAGRTALGWILNTSSLGAAISFTYTCAATFANAKPAGNRLYTALGAIGFVASIAFAVILVTPLLGKAFSPEEFVFLIAWVAIGANYFNPRIT